jgi:hypothetical protein
MELVWHNDTRKTVGPGTIGRYEVVVEPPAWEIEADKAKLFGQRQARPRFARWDWLE